MRNFSLLILLSIVIFPSGLRADDWYDTEFYNDGTAKKLSDFKGKTILVMFWATWCPYCKNQMPALSMLKNLYANVPNFEIAPISIDENGAIAVKNFFATYNINNLDKYVDDKSILFHSMGFDSIPKLVLVSKDGEILNSYNGLQNIDIKYLEKIIKTR